MPQDWEPNDWAETYASRVARQVKALRGSRSAQWLSDETEKWGYRVARATIADLENGRRRSVTIAEVAILAAALNTAPIALLYPPDYSDHIDVLPRVERTKIDAVQWFSGITDHGFTDLATSPDGPGAAGREWARLRTEYRANIRELHLWRDLLEVYKRISSVGIPAEGSISADKLALLDNYNDQVHSLRLQLGLEDLSDGG